MWLDLRRPSFHAQFSKDIWKYQFQFEVLHLSENDAICKHFTMHSAVNIQSLSMG